jgi:hypothetical protein
MMAVLFLLKIVKDVDGRKQQADTPIVLSLERERKSG